MSTPWCLRMISIIRSGGVISSRFGIVIVPKIRITACVGTFRSCSNLQDTPNVLQPVSRSSATNLRVKKISKAMKAYLERARNHETFISSKIDEYEIGRQHLANIMGLDVNSMTQNDIDRAIVYLLPSGLYERKARPMMKPPEQLYPKEKAAQFDEAGRPFSTFFYTKRSHFYTFLHETVGKFSELDAFEDKMLFKGFSEVPVQKRLNLNGSEWLDIDAVRSILLENIKEAEYQFLIGTLHRLAEHPYSFRCKDHIWKFRRDFEDRSADVIPPLISDGNNRLYAEHEGRKHTAIATVQVFGNGTGRININGIGIHYFKYWQEREQIMFPLELAGMLGKVDVEASVKDGGRSCQATAIRYGIAMCLRSFVTDEVRERLRLAGLLTPDRRRRERKKPGQKGSRAKFKWRKR